MTREELIKAYAWYYNALKRIQKYLSKHYNIDTISSLELKNRLECEHKIDSIYLRPDSERRYSMKLFFLAYINNSLGEKND